MIRRLPLAADWITWLLLTAVSAGLYACVACVSSRFEYSQPFAERPIPAMLGLLGAAFAVYLVAALFAARRTPTRGQLGLIAAAALLYRLILLPTYPIQEVDIYRYLWDGIVVCQGVNPFRFPPQLACDTRLDQATDPQLAKLVRVRDADPHVAELLTRIHYSELPSVYPPVSQAVFAAAAWTTPARASVGRCGLVLKIWLLGFDLATCGVILLLLRSTGRPPGLVILYAWCPLVLKEFANSGHLDAIAVFLTTLALWLAVRGQGRAGECRAGSHPSVPGTDSFGLEARRAGQGWPQSGAGLNQPVSGTEPIACDQSGAGQGGQETRREPVRQAGYRGRDALAAGLVLALAVGAKLYPVCLFPLFAALVLRSGGWKWCLAGSGVFLATTVLVLWPLVPAQRPAAVSPAGAAADPTRGLRTFLARWEMNDFLFMIAMENVKPGDLTPAGREAWFSVMPQFPREALIGPLAGWFEGDRWQAAFFVVRLASLLATVGIAAWCVQRAWAAEAPAVWLESAFLTLAWFWFLSPTLNPWYWTWVLPLLAWARSRVWWWLSGFVLVYYLRFWFIYQFPNTPVAGTAYAGAAFFDFIVTWCEFGPWLLWLTCQKCYLRFLPKRIRCKWTR